MLKRKIKVASTPHFSVSTITKFPIMKYAKLILLLVVFTSGFQSFAQTQDTTKTFPYVLPIWGQKVADRGMADQLQLPFGVNANYVNAFMDLKITQFELLVGGQDLTGIINTETLNFTSVTATTNGLSFRGDAWILPFMNVYGMFSTLKGSTDVSLQPTWKDAEGDVILQLPEFSSKVEFDALAYGVGTTFIFGWDNWFSSIDGNYSRTQTALLENQVGFVTLSARVGRRLGLSKKDKNFFVAPYIGVMYRNFVGVKGSDGSIAMDEVFPEADESFNSGVEGKVAANQAIIDDPNTSIAQRAKLQAQNQALENIQTKVNDSGLFTTEINYFIEKELVQTVTFQFGFNLQLNKNWMLRGEYGVASSQRFLVTGVQYRFGVKKKEFRQ
jgi:hypothetical protein